MSIPTDIAQPPRLGRVGRIEFVALMACAMALAALSIDVVLPAFEEIRTDFGLPGDSNQTAAIVSIFFLGMAVAQIPFGLLADRLGRKRTLTIGLTVFVVGAVGSATASTIEGVLAFRFVWGLGAAAPRVVSLSVVRDIYQGDGMARVMSFIAGVFILVPVVAPGLGAILLRVTDWRFLFWLCAAAGVGIWLWMLRLPETLPPERRMERLRLGPVIKAARLVVTDRQAVGYTIGLTFVFGAFISYLGSSELIWETVYGRGDQFPIIFGALAAVIGLSMVSNAALVPRFGARRIIHGALFAYVVTAGIALVVALATGGTPNFWLFMVLLALPSARPRPPHPEHQLAGDGAPRGRGRDRFGADRGGVDSGRVVDRHAHRPTVRRNGDPDDHRLLRRQRRRPDRHRGDGTRTVVRADLISQRRRRLLRGGVGPRRGRRPFQPPRWPGSSW
jgi:MFS transporter, DHA1 family, multidrug resistance protein